MFRIMTYCAAILLLFISLPVLGDSMLDCDQDGTPDLVCEGALCDSGGSGALGWCACLVHPGGAILFKSCLTGNQDPVLGQVEWLEDADIQGPGPGTCHDTSVTPSSSTPSAEAPVVDTTEIPLTATSEIAASKRVAA